ncbi:MAG: hypothetical protein U0V73_03595 [Acidimicrobiia bacterium]
MRCEDLTGVISELAEPGSPPALSSEARAHVEGCLRCQTEVAKYRRLYRGLRHLRARYIEPAPGVLAETLAALESAGERRALQSVLSGRRLAYAGAIGGAALAAGAAATVVLFARSRHRADRIAS